MDLYVTSTPEENQRIDLQDQFIRVGVDPRSPRPPPSVLSLPSNSTAPLPSSPFTAAAQLAQAHTIFFHPEELEVAHPIDAGGIEQGLGHTIYLQLPEDMSLEYKALAGLQLTAGPDAQWRSPLQKHTVVRALEARESFTVAAVTCGGKSMAYIIPALLEGNDHTFSVVVIPSRALITDALRKTEEAGICCKRWTINDNTRDDAKVLFVAVESFVTGEFQECVFSFLLVCLGD